MSIVAVFLTDKILKYNRGMAWNHRIIMGNIIIRYWPAIHCVLYYIALPSVRVAVSAVRTIVSLSTAVAALYWIHLPENTAHSRHMKITQNKKMDWRAPAGHRAGSVQSRLIRLRNWQEWSCTSKSRPRWDHRNQKVLEEALVLRVVIRSRREGSGYCAVTSFLRFGAFSIRKCIHVNISTRPFLRLTSTPYNNVHKWPK